MGLRFFADHCIPNLVIRTLMDEGHEVLQLKHHIPIESPDKMVIAAAQEHDSILISLEREDIQQAIEYAAWLTQEQVYSL